MDPSLKPTSPPIELVKPEAVLPVSFIGGTALGSLVTIEAIKDGSLTDRLRSIPGTAMTASSNSYMTEIFDGKATVLGNVEISGMSHISIGEIEEFTLDKVGKGGGKFGVGTYFALGNLKGETAGSLVDRYESGDAVRHDSKTTGNFLVMDRKSILAINEDIKNALGEPASNIRSSIRNSPDLTTKLQNFRINGQSIDGVVILMSSEDPSAEVIIMPSATSKIEIESRSRATDIPSTGVPATVVSPHTEQRILFKGRNVSSRVLYGGKKS